MVYMYRSKDDILHFLIKEKQTRWTLKELSENIFIPESILKGMLVSLQCDGYIKREVVNSHAFYSLINA